MRKKQKARPAGGTAEQAAEQVQASRQGHASKTNCTTAAASRQTQISDFLLHGQENAVPRRHLRQLTGLTDRELRSMRSRAREVEAVAAAVEGTGEMSEISPPSEG